MDFKIYFMFLSWISLLFLSFLFSFIRDILSIERKVFMKVTVLKNDEKKDYSIVYSILMMVLGIVLFLDANKVVTILFTILGALVILFGIYRFTYYAKMKKQFQMEDGNALISGVSSIAIGLLIILLSSILSNAIQIVTGIWLFFIGISKGTNAMAFKDLNRSLYLRDLIGSVFFLLLGIYTIFSHNVVFMIIGLALIVTASYDMYQYFQKKNQK